MKTLKFFVVALIMCGMSGCISFGSDSPGPQGPPGPSGASEKVIVIPEEKMNDKKVIVVPK